jgi:outer membrane lipoprotein-sorting protein
MTAASDPFGLLRNVSAAYRAITTLKIEAVLVNESGDEDASSRSEQRVQFAYGAPDRMRYEAGGKHGMFQVADGRHLHTVFRRHAFEGGSRVSSIPISGMHDLPHVFRPDFPLVNDGTFLFQGIEERVADARILRQEDGCYVVAVTYEQRSPHRGIVNRGDILFWVNTETLMVMKQQGDSGHRFPVDDEVRWTRLTTSVRNIRLNELLAEDAFRFTPPADANCAPIGQCGISMGGATGFIQNDSNERRQIEHRGSHEWQGDTLVERSKWKIRGIVLEFERRLTFSDDEEGLSIAERIKGPQGDAEGSFKISLK